MRLLNTSTLELRQFIGNDTPGYAILSHTWGDNEATFQDAPNFPRLRGRLAYLRQLRPPHALDDDDDDDLLTPGTCKILDFCDLAESDGHEWAWADTCCIDKSSSAELSEAINSMYRWYAESDSCYVYLSDVKTSSTQPGLLSHDAFGKSRWFTRGWTLQELLAPRLLEFYDVDWKTIGTKLHLCSRIVDRTGIPESALLEPWKMDFQELPAGRRFSWACDRETTREEDTAYSLMGLLDVNMPLLYGEGGEKAFHRLQQEYLLQREDLSLLLWTPWTRRWSSVPWLRQQRHSIAILAPHPVFFRRVQTLTHLGPETGFSSDTTVRARKTFEWANVVPVPHEGDPLAITSRGLRVKLLAIRDNAIDWPAWFAYTSCVVMGTDGQPDRKACISLKSTECRPYSDAVKGSTPTVTREEYSVWGVRDLEGFEWQEFYLDYRHKEERVKRTLAWPAENPSDVQEHFDALPLEIRLEVPANAEVGASMFPPQLGLVNGSSGKYRLTPTYVSYPPADGSCLSLQIGALVLDVPAPQDSTPSVETIAVTFGLTGAGSRFKDPRGLQSLHGSLIWCDIIRIPPASRPAEAMKAFLRESRDRALSAVLPDPKDKCRFSLRCGKTVWAFVRRRSWDTMVQGGICFPSIIHVVLQDEGNPESQPRWLSSQMNASLFPEAPRDWG